MPAKDAGWVTCTIVNSGIVNSSLFPRSSNDILDPKNYIDVKWLLGSKGSSRVLGKGCVLFFRKSVGINRAQSLFGTSENNVIELY